MVALWSGPITPKMRTVYCRQIDLQLPHQKLNSLCTLKVHSHLVKKKIFLFVSQSGDHLIS